MMMVLIAVFSSINFIWADVTVLTRNSWIRAVPVYTYYNYNYTQQIYPQANVGGAETFIGIRFYYAGGSTTNSNDWVIYMGNTTKSTFSSTTDWVPVTSLTQVFNGPVSYPAAEGWMNINLTVPFSYNGTDNLIVAVDENTANHATSPGANWGGYYFGSGVNKCLYGNNDTNISPNDPTANYTDCRLSAVCNNIILVTQPMILPSLTTQAVSNLSTYTATANGNITSLGSPFPTQHGFCWNTTGTPTTSDSKTVRGSTSVTGAFSSFVDPFSANTQYYMRAYATNLAGTAYGNQISFYSLPGSLWGFITPENVESGVNLSPTLSWNMPIGGCNGYKIYLGTDYPPTNVLNGYTQTTTSYTLSNLSINTRYYWKIVPYNNSGDTPDCPTWNFTTGSLPIMTTDSVISTSATTATGNGTIISLGADLLWEYGFCWNTVGSPTIADSKEYVGGAAGTGSYTVAITGLSGNTTYYMRAYGYNAIGTGYGTQTSVLTYPNPVTTPSPAHATSDVSRTPRLSWSAPTGGCTGYKVYFGTNNPPTNMVNGSIMTENYFYPPTLEPNTYYYWRVLAYNDTGEVTSSIWGFRTTSLPAAPASVTLTATSQHNATISWAPVEDASTFGYYVAIHSAETAYEQGVTDDPAWNFGFYEVGTNSVGFYDLVPGVSYYAYVCTINDSWAYTGYKRSNLELPNNTPTTPPIPEYPSPGDTFTGISVTPYLECQMAYTEHINDYDIYLYIGETLSAQYHSSNPFIDLSQLQPLLYGTTYTWRVDPTCWADTEYQQTTTGITWSFTTVDYIQVNADPVITDNGELYPAVAINDLEGEEGSAEVFVTAGYNLPEIGMVNTGLGFIIHPVNLTLPGHSVSLFHSLGYIPSQIAYRIEPATTWTLLYPESPLVTSWDDIQISFTLPASKADGDLLVIFPNQQGGTLPVELSSFTAVITGENLVRINWVTQSETDNLGYNILRSQCILLNTAVRLNLDVINTGQELGTLVNYEYTDSDLITTGDYYYWLESISLGGETELFGPINVHLSLPDDYTPPVIPEQTELGMAYPNPFNPVTSISYNLTTPGVVNIEIFSVRGQKIRSFQRSHSTAGKYHITWDGTDEQGKASASGAYLYRMQTGNYNCTRKMMLMK